MRQFVIAPLFLFLSLNKANACGLRAPSSENLLREIAINYEAPASKDLPAVIISGADSLVVMSEQGEQLVIDDKLKIQPGMTFSAKTKKVNILLPSTGQAVELTAGTTLKIVAINKASDQKICSVSFKMQSGKASFSSNHIEREKNCKPVAQDSFEVVTENVAITPVGTKYNVDLNQEIAELNGETYNEDISVDKGAVKIRLVRLKKENKKSDRKIAAKEYAFEEQKAVIVKAGKKAKVKKGKKDRLADIQIVYPDP